MLKESLAQGHTTNKICSQDSNSSCLTQELLISLKPVLLFVMYLIFKYCGLWESEKFVFIP